MRFRHQREHTSIRVYSRCPDNKIEYSTERVRMLSIERSPGALFLLIGLTPLTFPIRDISE